MSKRVLHLMNGFDLGGAETFVLNLCLQQRKQGYQAEVVAFKSGDLLRQFQEHQIPVYYGSEQKSLWGVCKTVLYLFFRTQFDVIHGHIFQACLVSRLVGKLKGKTIITTEHAITDVTHRPTFLRWVHKQTSKWNKKVVAVSHELKNIMLKAHYNAEQIVVIHDGIDLSRYHNKPSTAAGFVVGLMGRLHDEKGIDYGLKIFAEFAKTNPQATLCVAGDGPMRKEYEALAKELGIDSKITWLGFVAHPESFYQNISVLLCPSRYESFGLVVVEAMACGRLVVASNVGGLKDIVLDQETGFLCEVGAISDFVTRLQQIAGSQVSEEQMTAKAQAKAQEFSIEKSAQLYSRLY